jgi:3-oxoacyl-[acyl-carrier protein] reductase
MSRLSLTGKNAVVRGASRGIGRAAAERLAAEGANVVVNSSGMSAKGRALLDEAVEGINAGTVDTVVPGLHGDGLRPDRPGICWSGAAPEISGLLGLHR